MNKFLIENLKDELINYGASLELAQSIVDLKSLSIGSHIDVTVDGDRGILYYGEDLNIYISHDCDDGYDGTYYEGDNKILLDYVDKWDWSWCIQGTEDCHIMGDVEYSGPSKIHCEDCQIEIKEGKHCDLCKSILHTNNK